MNEELQYSAFIIQHSARISPLPLPDKRSPFSSRRFEEAGIRPHTKFGQNFSDRPEPARRAVRGGRHRPATTWCWKWARAPAR